ncbi:MAG: DUF898 domain-containing protein [Aestuariivirga sp.]|uniref:YjgN family protein n=1 Tax=Aestuariivirga sp. TaxID=2650926 RepID=UPI0025BFD0F7|nr:YjgN family protein [Aestuariivirga sp.]MCA3560457.1 DUF898 domain-containing protein [Aestuariivirga sp.]
MNNGSGPQPTDAAAPLGPAEPFVFTGSASEYYRIWIVNLMLTVVTLGIYSAWAKVRRLRYFYGNTLLQGHGFDYHADPVRILIGRLIVVGTLMVVNILSQTSPVFLLLIVPWLVALPWFINQSLAFNAQMTSYRNLRFGFQGAYFAGLGAFVLMPLLAIISAGLLAPFSSGFRANYLGSHTRFGTAWFDTDAPLGRLYANLGATMFFLIVLAVLVFGGLMLESRLVTGGSRDDRVAIFILLGVISFYISYFLVFYAYRAGVRNIVFNTTTLDGGHRLSSTLSRRRYVWIMISNALMVLGTLGLLWPVASVRHWRYLAQSTHFHPAGPLDGFLGRESQKSSVAAAEYLDLGGFDFGL